MLCYLFRKINKYKKNLNKKHNIMHNGNTKLFLWISVLASMYKMSFGQDFGYNGEKGPSHWGEQFNSCLGKHQSPIDIDSLHVKRVSLPELNLRGFSLEPDKMSVTNNGHTVMITMDSAEPIQISGGPLSDVYEFSQLHFHWGENDTQGSEDLIDGQSFPMELHIVFYKKRYRTVRSALDHADGLSVLAFFFDIADDDNPHYEGIAEILDNVTESKTSAEFPNPPTLHELLTTDLQHYYTYNGSLTTPPCSEVVVWLDFKHPIPLSHRQIEKFREIQDEEGHQLTNNFRPIQPIGDRIVLYNTPEIDDNKLDDDINHNNLDDHEKSNEKDLRHDTDINDDDDSNEDIMNDEPTKSDNDDIDKNAKKSKLPYDNGCDSSGTKINVILALLIYSQIIMIVNT